MRWFKHLTGAHQDEEMAAVISQMGPEGYGVWWIILEVIGSQMDSSDKCSARYSAKKWGSFCGFSAKKFQKFAEKLAEISSISVKVSGEFLEIGCRNLLKFRDEYSKKSGQTPESVRSKKQSIETETETETEKPIDHRSSFDDFWKEYPRKVGKGDAERAWKKIKQPESTLLQILSALAWQRKSEQWTKDNGRYIPNPATYLNQRRWEDEDGGGGGSGMDEEEAMNRLRLISEGKLKPGEGIIGF